MKSTANCRVVVGSLVVLSGLMSTAGAKTIIVDSYDAAALLKPGRHFVDRTLAGTHAGAMFRPVSTAVGASLSGGSQREAGVNFSDPQASFGAPTAISDLYNEGRRLASNGLHGANAAAADGKSMLPPVQQSDFRAMLLVGALLVVQQLRRKHRSLKQFLIAG